MFRREFVLGAACGAGSPMLAACSAGASHDEAARILRRPVAASAGDNTMLMRELVRYATLAPSSHNTQCWKFRLRDQGPTRSITIEPDLARRTPVVDPDDHHLFVSLGCATENLVQAALANGLQGDARFDPTGAGAIAVSLQATQAISSPLFQAISERQCTRGDYDGQPLTAPELRLLEQAGPGNGVRVMLLTERFKWWSRRESNPRPQAITGQFYMRSALIRFSPHRRAGTRCGRSQSPKSRFEPSDPIQSQPM